MYDSMSHLPPLLQDDGNVVDAASEDEEDSDAEVADAVQALAQQAAQQEVSVRTGACTSAANARFEYKSPAKKACPDLT